MRLYSTNGRKNTQLSKQLQYALLAWHTRYSASPCRQKCVAQLVLNSIWACWCHQCKRRKGRGWQTLKRRIRVHGFHTLLQRLVDRIVETALYAQSGLHCACCRRVLWPLLLGVLPLRDVTKRLPLTCRWNSWNLQPPKKDIELIKKDVDRAASLFRWPREKQLRALHSLLLRVFGRHQKLAYTQGVHEVLALLIRLWNTVGRTQKTVVDAAGSGDDAVLREAKASFQTLQPSRKTTAASRNRSRAEREVLIQASERLLSHHLYDYLAVPLEYTMPPNLKTIGAILYDLDPPLFSLITLEAQCSAYLKNNNLSLENIGTVEAFSETGFHFCIPWLMTLFTHDLLSRGSRYTGQSPLSSSNEIRPSSKAFSICCRIWDSLLAAPPLFPLYFCATILIQQEVRSKLFEMAQRYGIREDETRARSRGHASPKLLKGLQLAGCIGDLNSVWALQAEIHSWLYRLFSEYPLDELKRVVFHSLAQTASLLASKNHLKLPSCSSWSLHMRYGKRVTDKTVQQVSHQFVHGLNTSRTFDVSFLERFLRTLQTPHFFFSNAMIQNALTSGRKVLESTNFITTPLLRKSKWDGRRRRYRLKKGEFYTPHLSRRRKTKIQLIKHWEFVNQQATYQRIITTGLSIVVLFTRFWNWILHFIAVFWVCPRSHLGSQCNGIRKHDGRKERVELRCRNCIRWVAATVDAFVQQLTALVPSHMVLTAVLCAACGIFVLRHLSEGATMFVLFLSDLLRD